MGRSTQGFTLVEAATAMAVLLVTLTIALPGLARLVERNRQSAAIGALVSQLAATRTAAISRNIPVALCPSAATDRCDQRSDWSHGWIMYSDPDGDRQPNSDADILRVGASIGNAKLRVLSSSGRPQIRYLPDGRTAGTNATFSLCDGPELVAEVVVNTVGRTRSGRTAAGQPCPL